jgi:hypothetical protein
MLSSRFFVSAGRARFPARPQSASFRRQRLFHFTSFSFRFIIAYLRARATLSSLFSQHSEKNTIQTRPKLQRAAIFGFFLALRRAAW